MESTARGCAGGIHCRRGLADLAELDAHERFGQHGHTIGLFAHDQARLVAARIELDQSLDLHVQRIGDVVKREVGDRADVQAGRERRGYVLTHHHGDTVDAIGFTELLRRLPQELTGARRRAGIVAELRDLRDRGPAEKPACLREVTGLEAVFGRDQPFKRDAR